jgi:hypothetical protein
MTKQTATQLATSIKELLTSNQNLQESIIVQETPDNIPEGIDVSVVIVGRPFIVINFVQSLEEDDTLINSVDLFVNPVNDASAVAYVTALVAKNIPSEFELNIKGVCDPVFETQGISYDVDYVYGKFAKYISAFNEDEANANLELSNRSKTEE